MDSNLDFLITHIGRSEMVNARCCMKG